MNSSTLFFYFGESKECFAVQAISSGYMKDKSKKLYHLEPGYYAQELLDYVKFKYKTEKESNDTSPTIIVRQVSGYPPLCTLKYKGWIVDFTPNKFIEEPIVAEEKSMNTKYMKKDHIIQVLDAIEQKITSNQSVKELILDNEVAGYRITGKVSDKKPMLIYKVGMILVTFDALKLRIEEFFSKNPDLLKQMVQDLEMLFYLLSEEISSKKKMQDFLDKISKADEIEDGKE